MILILGSEHHLLLGLALCVSIQLCKHAGRKADGALARCRLGILEAPTAARASAKHGAANVGDTAVPIDVPPLQSQVLAWANTCLQRERKENAPAVVLARGQEARGFLG